MTFIKGSNMHIKTRKAFTITELVFVIVVIGILSAIAIPKFQESSILAHDAKAKSQIISVMSAVAAERQRRILRGDFTPITDLGDATNAFSLMSADGDGNQAVVLQYPIVNCSATQRACWIRTAATDYTYRFVDSSTGTDGQADFVLTNSRLDCAAGDTSDCLLITK